MRSVGDKRESFSLSFAPRDLPKAQGAPFWPPLNASNQRLMKAFVKSKPMVTIFWLWIAVSLVVWASSLVDGSLHEMMLLAVDISGADLSGVDRDAMATTFIWLSFAYFAFSSVVGGLLVHLATAGHRWAAFLLIPGGLWWGYESISFPFATSDLYPGMIDWLYWLLAMLGGAVWAAILAFNIRKLRARSL